MTLRVTTKSRSLSQPAVFLWPATRKYAADVHCGVGGHGRAWRNSLVPRGRAGIYRTLVFVSPRATGFRIKSGKTNCEATPSDLLGHALRKTLQLSQIPGIGHVSAVV